MFLKTEKLERNGHCVMLYQLSALQRIEFLECLKKIEAIDDGDIQSAITTTIQVGALVVAMSLWHGHAVKNTLSDGAAEVELIQNEVMQSWPSELIAEADYKVKLLSGMIDPSPDPADEEPIDPEPVTAEKPSPVS